MKGLVTADALLHYPDHNQPFEIETDVSNYQLGAILKQHGHLVAYYSRKLTPAQKNYTTIEKELLSIVETFQEFLSLLLGAKLHVYMDHKNLTHALTHFTTQCVLCWHLLLEEYRATFHYKKGSLNFMTDVLSHVPTSHVERESSPPPISLPAASPDSPADGLHIHQCLLHDDPILADGLLVHPELDEQGRVPTNFKTIYEYQQADGHCQVLPMTHPHQFHYENLGGFSIVCVNTDRHIKMVIPDDLLPPLVRWYHEATTHAAGITCLDLAIKQYFYHHSLSREICTQMSACDLCQHMKHGSWQYRKLPAWSIDLPPWHEVQTDCIGPWSFLLHGGVQFQVQALTTIDTCTNLLEIHSLLTKTSAKVSQAFENGRLLHYLHPLCIMHDQGPEFLGHEFQMLLFCAGIQLIPTTACNPQANSIVKAVHRSIGQVLCMLIHLHSPKSQPQAETLVQTACATAMHASHCAAHQSLCNHSLDAIAF